MYLILVQVLWFDWDWWFGFGLVVWIGGLEWTWLSSVMNYCVLFCRIVQDCALVCIRNSLLVWAPKGKQVSFGFVTSCGEYLLYIVWLFNTLDPYFLLL